MKTRMYILWYWSNTSGHCHRPHHPGLLHNLVELQPMCSQRYHLGTSDNEDSPTHNHTWKQIFDDILITIHVTKQLIILTFRRFDLCHRPSSEKAGTQCGWVRRTVISIVFQPNINLFYENTMTLPDLAGITRIQ